MTDRIQILTAGSATEEASPEQEDIYAEAVKSLFGAGGPLFGVLPEGTNIDEMVDTSREQMGQADQEIRQVLDEVAEKAQNDSIDPMSNRIRSKSMRKRFWKGSWGPQTLRRMILFPLLPLMRS